MIVLFKTNYLQTVINFETFMFLKVTFMSCHEKRRYSDIALFMYMLFCIYYKFGTSCDHFGQVTDGENIFVTFFSATINQSQMKFSLQLQYGVLYYGIQFHVCCTSTSCLLQPSHFCLRPIFICFCKNTNLSYSQ